jgi:hypothetical protein
MRARYPASREPASGHCGFSSKPITRSDESMLTMPNRDESVIGTSMVAIVASALFSTWNRSILA